MAGAAQGSCSQTALMIVHSASVSSIVRFGMDEQLSLVIELYSCKDVNTIFYSCRALGTGLPTKPEDALQMDGTNDGHKKAQKAQKHAALVLFVAHGFTVCSNRISIPFCTGRRPGLHCASPACRRIAPRVPARSRTSARDRGAGSRWAMGPDGRDTFLFSSANCREFSRISGSRQIRVSSGWYSLPDEESKRFVRIRLQPLGKAGQRKGEQALDFGAGERRGAGPWRAGIVFAPGAFDARIQLRPARGDQLAHLPAGQSFAAGEVVEAGSVLRHELPNRARRDHCRQRRAEFVHKQVQRPAGLPGAAHLLIKAAIARG